MADSLRLVGVSRFSCLGYAKPADRLVRRPATFRHSRLPRNLACGSIFFVKIRNDHRRASIGQNLPRARSPPVLESRLCCFATEAMQSCTRFGSFENPSILLSGLRVAVRFHYSGMGKAQTPQGCFRSSKSEKVRSRASTAEGRRSPIELRFMFFR